MSRGTEFKFTIILDAERKSKLLELKEIQSMSQGAVLRQLIDHAWLMRLHNIPMCATGAPCPAPHLHGKTIVPEQTALEQPG